MSPLRKRRLPLLVGSRLAKERSPLQALPCWPWLHLIAPLRGGLAIAGCPYNRPSHGWSPTQGAWPWPATPASAGGLASCPFLATLATKMQQEHVE
ncbi:hypothetical protein GW17_00054832 [Ensete ventricosum]|nr:hypothetical protein GW17_00054832 [Ensete ventricosum]